MLNVFPKHNQQSPKSSEHCHDEFINQECQECLVVFGGSLQQLLLQCLRGRLPMSSDFSMSWQPSWWRCKYSKTTMISDTLLYCSSSYSMLFQSNRRMIKTWCKFHVVSMISGSFPQVSYVTLLSNDTIKTSQFQNSSLDLPEYLPILSKENPWSKLHRSLKCWSKKKVSTSHTNVLRTSPVYVRNSFK